MTKVLKIDFSPYILRTQKPLNSKAKQYERHGALLRFCFKDFGYGYADCHPLEEFGDLPLKKQLENLKHKKFTNITQRSLHYATWDTQLRTQNQSAFQAFKCFPQNNYTSPALIKKEDLLTHKEKGFTVFKFKCGHHLPNEVNYVQNMASFFKEHKLKMRLDFNGNIKDENTLQELSLYADIIEYIEDPFHEFNEITIPILQKFKHVLKFATDFYVPTENNILDCFVYKIIKPTRENPLQLDSSKKTVFTSAMDHPLGQMCALYSASLFLNEKLHQKNLNAPLNESSHEQNQATTCGLITQHLFEETPYSKLLKVKQNILFPADGTGFGFDGLLRSEPWKACFSL